MQRKGCQNPSRHLWRCACRRPTWWCSFFCLFNDISLNWECEQTYTPLDLQKLMDAAWARCQKKTGISHSHLRIYPRGRKKKQRADAVLITFHAPWRTRSAPCMCWTPLPYFCWQQFFSRDSGWPICDETWPCFVWATSQCITYIYTCYIIAIQYWYFSTFENKACKTYVLA